MRIPPLKIEPKYGYFRWWPEDGDDWVYPEDVSIARSMIPSPRIFRRDGEPGEFVVLHYGAIKFRVRRTLWEQVEPEGFELGDWVEVLSRGWINTPRTGTIREMVWDAHARGIRYQIVQNDVPIEDFYSRDDLQHVEPV